MKLASDLVKYPAHPAGVHYCEVESKRAFFAGLKFSPAAFWGIIPERRTAFAEALKVRWQQYEGQKEEQIKTYFEKLIVGPFLAAHYGPDDVKRYLRDLAVDFASPQRRAELIGALCLPTFFVPPNDFVFGVLHTLQTILCGLDSADVQAAQHAIQQLGIAHWTENYVVSDDEKALVWKAIKKIACQRNSLLEKVLCVLSNFCCGPPDVLAFANVHCRCAEDNAVIGMADDLLRLKKPISDIKVTWYSASIETPAEAKDRKQPVYKPLCGVCDVVFVPRTEKMIEYLRSVLSVSNQEEN